MWLAKGAAAFCYIHQTSCHKDPRRCPCTADRFHTYIQPPPPQITTQGQLVQMYTRAEGHARESRHTPPRRTPMDVCGEWGGTHLAVGGSWCMKWPYNVTAGEREGAIMVFNARKEDISDFCWTNRVASFHGTLTATYSHTPPSIATTIRSLSRQFVENNRGKGASLFLSNNLVDTLLYRCGLFLVSLKWSWCRTRGRTNRRM